MMGPSEPRLRPEDHRAWAMWQRTARVHARTLAHLAKVDEAKRVAEIGLRVAPRSVLMASGGKDSTVMTHLVCVEMGAKIPVFSEKDTLDFPGETEYMQHLAEVWSLNLTILTPPVSPVQWVAEHAHELAAGEDIHGRAAGLSKACFYDVVEEAARPFDGIFLGLRQEESAARRADRATHYATIDGERVLGLYQRRGGANPGQWRVTPIGDWSGLDVYAYAESHNIELLPLYKCIAFMHADEPWRVRKSWWLPGASTRHGGAAWLNRYYPSLYSQMRCWLPDAQSFR